MYNGFLEDVEYVMGLFFRPFEEFCGSDDDGDEEKNSGMGCDEAPCFRREEDDEEEDAEGSACDCAPQRKDEDAEDEADDDPSGRGGLMGTGPMQDVLKCLFDASDIDYDYED